MTLRDITIVMIVHSVAFFPVVIFTGMNFQPGKNCPFIDLCSTAYFLDIIHDLIPYFRLDPATIQISPCRLFFRVIFSSTSSEINRSLSFIRFYSRMILPCCPWDLRTCVWLNMSGADSNNCFFHL